MNKQRVAQIITILILVGVLGVTLARKNGWNPRAILARQKAEAEPEDGIYARLDPARNGDVKRYLGAYSVARAAALRQSIRECAAAAVQVVQGRAESWGLRPQR